MISAMLSQRGVLRSLAGIVVFGAATIACAQDPSPKNEAVDQMKDIVVAPQAKSGSVIAIPPATSVTMALQTGKPSESEASDLSTWIRAESARNGLQSTDLKPWYIRISYDRYDEDGDNVDSGTYEEFWAGPKKYKRIYDADNFNQTDYATEKGLFRRGDQRWPTPAELQVRSEIIDPFYYAATLHGFQTRTVERTFSGYKLQCTLLENQVPLSDPTQYCFEPNGHVLRYNRGSGWNQTVYNRILTFQGRNIAQDVDVTDGGKPYLKLRVEKIELISNVNDSDFAPLQEAVEIGGRISGVRPTQIKTVFPDWPASVRGQHISVEVDFVIGTDGRVVEAHAVSGPEKGRKACEDAVRKSIFAPYLVLDKPVEVESKYECRYN